MFPPNNGRQVSFERFPYNVEGCSVVVKERNTAVDTRIGLWKRGAIFTDTFQVSCIANLTQDFAGLLSAHGCQTLSEIHTRFLCFGDT